MKTRRWKVRMQFEVSLWYMITPNAVVSKARDLLGRQCENVYVEVEEIAGD